MANGNVTLSVGDDNNTRETRDILYDYIPSVYNTRITLSRVNDGHFIQKKKKNNAYRYKTY